MSAAHPAVLTNPDKCLCGGKLPCKYHPDWNPPACYHCGSTAESVQDRKAWLGTDDPAICCIPKESH